MLTVETKLAQSVTAAQNDPSVDKKFQYEQRKSESQTIKRAQM